LKLLDVLGNAGRKNAGAEYADNSTGSAAIGSSKFSCARVVAALKLFRK